MTPHQHLALALIREGRISYTRTERAAIAGAVRDVLEAQNAQITAWTAGKAGRARQISQRCARLISALRQCIRAQQQARALRALDKAHRLTQAPAIQPITGPLIEHVVLHRGRVTERHRSPALRHRDALAHQAAALLREVQP